MMELKIKFFDFEVFKQDWFVTFLDAKDNSYITFRNDTLGLIDFVEKNKKDTCFVGYNSNYFDLYCLRCIYNGINPYRIVDWSIKNGRSPWELPELRGGTNPNIISYDVMVGVMTPVGLKEAEGNMGSSIEEMNFDLEYGGKLPDDIYQRLLKYNYHDVEETKKVFDNYIKDDFHAKQRLLEKFDMSYINMRLTYPRIIKEIFKASEIPQKESYYYKHPENIVLKDKTILDVYESHLMIPFDEFSFERKIQDVVYTFAVGGGHGALENFIHRLKDDEVALIADVNSLYPNLMIIYKYLSRCIPDPKGYEDVVNDRIKYKLVGNNIDAEAYKKIINPIYGASRQFIGKDTGRPGGLCDWEMGTNVCITGQLLLWMLAEMCNLPTTKFFNLNTDGIYMIVNKVYLEQVKEQLNKWQEITGLKLDIDTIEKGAIIQKDVNNYILYDEKKNKIKVKGKEVKKWQGGDYKSNSCSIVDEAIVKYFVYNKPINETIQEAFDKNEVIKFQIILSRKGKNYTATMWGNKEVQKINRVFPTFDQNKEPITKVKNGKKNKFPNAPEHCYVDNRDVKEINLKEIQLDLNYYLDLANKKIKQFRGD